MIMSSTTKSYQNQCGDSSIDHISAEVEHLTQGQGKRLDFEDGGQVIKTFGAKRPRLVV
jgi:hypothetical protein